MLSEDGTKAEFDSPENLKALKFMVDGIKDGAAPKAVTTYMEEQARMSFEAGRATFERNWPYAYAAGKKNTKTPDFKVVAFPEFEGGGKAGILGGHNDVISVYGKNPGGSLKVLDFLSSEEEAVTLAKRVLAAAGDRLGVRRSRASRRRCRSRPSSSRRSPRRSLARSRRSTRRSPRRSTRTSTRPCRVPCRLRTP